ncbi:MAG: VOC family protein [Deinococcales bacterium]|nr:VOC family protein [Deinococcales bacterium]
MAEKIINFDGFIGFYGSTNLEKTREFYEGLLRLTLARNQKRCLIYKVTDKAFIGFCLREGPFVNNACSIITFVTKDVDTVYRRMCKHEIQCEGKPVLNEFFGIYHFFTADPDGNRVEVQQFLEPL